ncbi:2Fe-2S iron-sulfur cluster binding domain-containing protein [Mycobacterium sp. NPDC050853]|uniref:2Fe-2S iron-sulfur cluster-binding protein n=1 Tax=Mycobacterium sp. NPDC050853 TaxID=3155160 RepID=UPI00340D4E2B
MPKSVEDMADIGDVALHARNVAARRSALETILANKPGTAHSCRQGFCGTRKVKVLAGRPDHRDTTLTESQRAKGQTLICASRADGGRLVLDI